MSRECKLPQHHWITCMWLSAWIYWKWKKLHRWILNNKEMRSWMISFRSFSLSLFVCRVLCSRGIIRAVNSVCFRWYLLYLREKISKIAVWLTGPARESHETRKLQTSILLFSYMYLYDSWIKTKSHFSFFSLFFFFYFERYWRMHNIPWQMPRKRDLQ